MLGQVIPLSKGRKVNGKYPPDQLSFNQGTSVVLADAAVDGASGFWTVALGQAPRKSKDSFKSMALSSLPEGTAGLVYLEELRVEFMQKYEANELEDFIKDIAPNKFSLPYPPASDPRYLKLFEHQQGEPPRMTCTHDDEIDRPLPPCCRPSALQSSKGNPDGG